MIYNLVFGALLLTSMCFPSSRSYETNTFKKERYDKNELATINRQDLRNEYLFNKDLKEQYLLRYNDRECFVVDLTTNNKVFYSDDFTYPYTNKDNYHIFNDSYETDNRFLCSDGQLVWEPFNENYKILLSEGYNGVSSFQEYQANITSVPSSAHKINNYQYYLRLGQRHCFNPNNLCTLISIQMIASYYDTFLNDIYVPEEWDYLSLGYVSNTNNWENWNDSPGAGYEAGAIADFRMCQYLLTYTQQNINSYVTSTGLTYIQQRNLLNYYLGQRSVGYSLNTSAGNWADCVNKKAKTVIKNGIDNNRPVIANGRHHSVVAFAYDDDYVYVHTGWGHCSKVVWATFTDWDATYSPSAIDVIPSGSHSHCNNYYSTYNDKFYCSCGQQMNGTIGNISNFGLPSSPLAYQSGTYYNSTFSADISYRNVYLDNNCIAFLGDSTLVFDLDVPIYGLMIKGSAYHTSGYTPSMTVDFYDDNYDLCGTYSLSSYTYLQFNNTSSEIAINCEASAKSVVILVEPNNCPYLFLSIEKIVLGV